jgi:hypothetical protein
MVASDEALPARAEDPTIVLSQLEGLVHPAVSVAQIRRLRLAEVNAQTLRPTGEDKSSQYLRYTKPQSTTYNPIAFANCIKPSFDRTPAELLPDIITCLFPPPTE